MILLDYFAPRFSRRRLVLSIARDAYYKPSSILGRLASVNFHNDRVCAGLTMHCNVCGHDGAMVYDYPDVRIRKAHGIGLLRETLRCRACGATMRDRQLAHGLLHVIATRLNQIEPDLLSFRQSPRGELSILDSDSFSPLNRVLRGLPGYVHSQFVPGRSNGDTLSDGSVLVNLEDIPFAGGSFDVILTSDVMEHVVDDARAHREIYRCLAPGGTYLCTIPYDPSLWGHRRLTQSTGTEAYFILDKQVHGDPHASSGIIAHRIYGRQVFEDLKASGYAVRFEQVEQPKHGIFGGDLFFANKGL